MFVLVAAQAAMSRFAKIGFLCSMESLLSTAGKEQSMLKDVQGVVELIKHSFSFLQKAHAQPTPRVDPNCQERQA